jgi:uncharacterized membrane protein (UPF0127 family)
LSQAIGLMFSRRRLDTGYLFVFSRLWYVPITMVFVFYPIDVIWLNERREVVCKKRGLPFQLHLGCKKKVKYVLEISSSTIKIGDVLDW